MYSIEETDYGFKLEFGGMMTTEEMSKWKDESFKKLKASKKTVFGCVIDMHTLKPLQPETKSVLEAGQKLYAEKGMKHSAVLVPTKLIAMQMRNTAAASGIASGEKYFDLEDSNAEKNAIAWAKEAK